jgi:hypothetical protein
MPNSIYAARLAMSLPRALTLLLTLDPLIIRNRGARFKGDVFNVLFKCPYVIRDFKFAAVDGVLDCTVDSPESAYASFADRLWELNKQL